MDQWFEGKNSEPRTINLQDLTSLAPPEITTRPVLSKIVPEKNAEPPVKNSNEPKQEAQVEDVKKEDIEESNAEKKEEVVSNDSQEDDYKSSYGVKKSPSKEGSSNSGTFTPPALRSVSGRVGIKDSEAAKDTSSTEGGAESTFERAAFSVSESDVVKALKNQILEQKDKLSKQAEKIERLVEQYSQKFGSRDNLISSLETQVEKLALDVSHLKNYVSQKNETEKTGDHEKELGTKKSIEDLEAAINEKDKIISQLRDELKKLRE